MNWKLCPRGALEDMFVPVVTFIVLLPVLVAMLPFWLMGAFWQYITAELD